MEFISVTVMIDETRPAAISAKFSKFSNNFIQKPNLIPLGGTTGVLTIATAK